VKRRWHKRKWLLFNLCNISTIVSSVHPFRHKGLVHQLYHIIYHRLHPIGFIYTTSMHTPRMCKLICLTQHISCIHEIMLAKCERRNSPFLSSWQITNKLQLRIVELSSTIPSVDFSTTLSCHMRLQLFFSMIRILMNSCISQQLALPERRQHLLGSCGFAHRKCTREHPSAAICQLSSTCQR